MIRFNLSCMVIVGMVAAYVQGAESVINLDKLSQVKISALSNYTPKKNIDIKKAMEWPLEQVLKRYQKDYKVSEEVAKVHERELKRYLIISAEISPDTLKMFSPEVDNFWHTFLLFTNEYEKYCQENFGCFLHHIPKIIE